MDLIVQCAALAQQPSQLEANSVGCHDPRRTVARFALSTLARTVFNSLEMLR